MKEIEGERRRLREIESKVEERERENERIRLKAEIERDNMRMMQELIGMSERRSQEKLMLMSYNTMHNPYVT